mgnify:CR=1 FL=1
MSGILVAMQGAVAQGVLWGIMVLGVYITYRLLDIADLTVDGSFALGGCVCATLIINFDLDPLAALLLSMLAGMAAGDEDGLRSGGSHRRVWLRSQAVSDDGEGVCKG